VKLARSFGPGKRGSPRARTHAAYRNSAWMSEALSIGCVEPADEIARICAAQAESTAGVRSAFA
jgi:hypothetical protein